MTNFKQLRPLIGNTQGTKAELDRLVKSYNSLIALWNNELFPLLNDLPKGSKDVRWHLLDRINALVQLDGANLFVDNKAKAGDAHYFTEENRPYTLKELLTRQVIPGETLAIQSELVIYNEDVLQGVVEAINFDSGFAVELDQGIAYISAGISVEDDGDLLIGRGQVDTLNASDGLVLDSPQEGRLRISLDTSVVVEMIAGAEGIIPEDCVEEGDLVQVGPGSPGQIPILNDQGLLDLDFFDLAVPGVPADEGKPVMTDSFGFYPLAAWDVQEIPVGSQPIISYPDGYLAKEIMSHYAGDITGAWGNARVMGLNGWPLDSSVLTPTNGDSLVFSSGTYVSEPSPGPGSRDGHIPDSDTVVLWRLDDTLGSTTVTDASSNARHGVRDPSYSQQTIGPFPGVKGLEYSSVRTAGSGGDIYGGVVYTGDNSPFRLLGEMTFECWLYLYTFQSDDNEQSIVSCASDLSGTSLAADNILYHISLIGGGNNGIHSINYQHRTSGTWVPHTLSLSDLYLYNHSHLSITPHQWHHFAFRRTFNASNLDIDFFVDGVKRRFATNIAAPSSGSSARIKLMNLYFPSVTSGSPALHGSFNGIMAEVHLSDVARSDGYILADYQRGAGL